MARAHFVMAVTPLLLLVGTVAAFAAIDRNSHSVSDTLRPFIVTMVPLWLIAMAAVRLLLRQRVRPKS